MCLIALCPLKAAAQDADGDAQAPASSDRFHSTMDRVLGAGRWRQTSGYRTPAQEAELRRQGAGTVPAGHLSHHSLGSRDAPGAYDVVVDGMSLGAAATKLKGSGKTFAKVMLEGAHGPEGAHLHIEPSQSQVRDPGPQPDPDDTVYLRVAGGKRNPKLARGSFAVARAN